MYQTLLSKATYSAFRLYIFCQYMCSLGIEPTTFALLTQCSTTEPQEHFYINKNILPPNNVFHQKQLCLQQNGAQTKTEWKTCFTAWGFIFIDQYLPIFINQHLYCAIVEGSNLCALLFAERSFWFCTGYLYSCTREARMLLQRLLSL